MNLKNQGPIFVPDAYCAEIERLSKAALMDLVWDYAQSCSSSDVMDEAATMRSLCARRDIILIHRKQAKDAA